jgi:cyclopropane fatty-acyl-phospholipid synthase-like methyltransferase
MICLVLEGQMANLSDLVVFVDRTLADRYAGRTMPFAALTEAYLDGAVDIPDVDALLDARRDVANFQLTPDHVKFLVTRMIPEWLIHSRSQDQRIVRDHYDRGNDFFEAFLGETMVYTSGYFRDPAESLEQAQTNKMDLVCRKLMVRPGDELLDVGCGWGTLVMHAAANYGATTTGVTLAERGASFARARIARAGLETRAGIACVDYRDMPRKKYDRIVSLEMVEHVGIKNLPKFFAGIRERLKDDGLFLMQWCGMRPGGEEGVAPVGLRPEDMIWGLFMNKYVFSGADASLPLGEMVRFMEKAGFEIQSSENLSVHYAWTIQRWHQNWQRNRAAVLKAYGERWYRLWNLFLAWSWRIGLQGTSACHQVVAHKNLDAFDRTFTVRSAAPSPAHPRRVARDEAAQ